MDGESKLACLIHMIEVDVSILAASKSLQSNPIGIKAPTRLPSY